MPTKDIARKMVDPCRQGKNMEALETLFADDVVRMQMDEVGL